MKILWIPHTGWHIPQRAHLFCRALSERHEVHVTDWVADFTSLGDYLSLRYMRNFVYRRYRDGAIIVHGIPRLSPALFIPALRRLNRAIFSRVLARIIETHRIDAVVGTFVAPPPEAPRLVFDLFDDNVAYWRSFGRVPGYAAEIAEIERAYVRQADAVVAVSSVLADRVREMGSPGSVHHIPNGVDLSLFEGGDGTGLRDRWGLNGRVVGMVGNHDKTEELDKVLQAAKALAAQDITFLVAGRGTAMAGARGLAQREGLDNVVFKGYLPPQRAAQAVCILDVGLCPYRKTTGADASSPMRLLMYAAAGVPTVCTDLEEVRRMGFANVVLVEDDVHSLVSGVRSALQLPRSRPSQIQGYEISCLIQRYEAVLCG